jgi:hypothetical protein
MPVVDAELGFTKVTASHEFEVLDDASTTFRSEHKFEIRAELRGRFFLRRYTWTGSEDEAPPILETPYDVWGHPLHRIHGPVIHEGVWRIVLVDLGRTFEVGDQDTVHFYHRLRDLNGKFEPYLGHDPKPGTQHIRLFVILPDTLAHDVVFDERMLDTDNVIKQVPLLGKPIDGGRTSFETEVPDPITVNRGYRIRWTRRAKRV